MMLRGDLETFEYLSENETRNKNILTHWSVAQAGSSDEKIMRVENLVGLSLQSHKSLNLQEDAQNVTKCFWEQLTNSDHTQPVEFLYKNNGPP